MNRLRSPVFASLCFEFSSGPWGFEFLHAYISCNVCSVCNCQALDNGLNGMSELRMLATSLARALSLALGHQPSHAFSDWNVSRGVLFLG